MASTTTALTHKSLAVLQKERKKALTKMKGLPAGHPEKPALRTHIQALSTQISAIKAAKDVQRSPEQLAKAIARQKARIAKLTKVFQAAKGKDKVRTGKRLARAKRRLAEMTAAGHVKKVGVVPGVPVSPANLTLVPSLSGIADEPEVSPEADPELTAEQAEAVEEGYYQPEFDGNYDLAVLGEYVDDLRYNSGEWYKNPLLLVAASGLVVLLVLRRR